MAYRRHKYLNLENTKYYHCITRCVRRAFLCGYDPLKNINYDYRKEIIRNLLRQLTKAYSIEICSYAIMCNHVHLVLYANDSQVAKLSHSQILKRWALVYPTSASKIQADILNKESSDKILQKLESCREKLCSIRSFMERFCVSLSKKFNKEDNERFMHAKRQLVFLNAKKTKISENLINNLTQVDSLYCLSEIEILNESINIELYQYLKLLDTFASAVWKKNNKNYDQNYKNIFQRLIS